MKVFITVDTEVWPNSPGWPHTPLPEDYEAARDLEAYFLGGAGAGAKGLPFQLQVLARHGLKATYFVDPMFSFALGLEPLERVVTMIRRSGQEIGLHLHPEWLTDPRCGDMPPFAGPLLHRYPSEHQRCLIERAAARLAEAGAPGVTAFRAGSWGASRATVAALAACGLRFDSSLNGRFDASFPDMARAERSARTHPFLLDGIWEFPVTNFVDMPPYRRRPLHVCAASYDEMRMVLEHGRDHGWYAAVIVLHGFEFARVSRLAEGRAVTPQRLLAHRFERLCSFLAGHRDGFETCHFDDVETGSIPNVAPPPIPVSTHARTVLRHVEQLASRVY